MRLAQSLADLERRAAEIVDPQEGGTRGRRTTVDGCRQVESLTQAQYRKIVTACNTMARHQDPDAGRDPERLKAAKERIDGPVFAWDPDAGVGSSGDWRAAVEMMERASSEGSRATNVSAIRTPLDAAATHGWIPRTDRHDPDYVPVPPEWAELYHDWREIGGLGGEVLFCLFEACSRLGIQDPATADFNPVVELIEQDWAGGKEVDGSVKSNIRRIYRTLREEGAISGPDWNGNASGVLCRVSGCPPYNLVPLTESVELVERRVAVRARRFHIVAHVPPPHLVRQPKCCLEGSLRRSVGLRKRSPISGFRGRDGR